MSEPLITDVPVSTSYYRLDSRNLTFHEYWRLTPGAGFVIAALLKILRVRLPVRMALAYPERYLVRAPAELPREDYQRLVPFITPCERQGIRVQLFYQIPMISPDSRSLGVALLSDDRLVYGFLAISETSTAMGVQRQIGLSLVTPLSNGRLLSTSGTKKKMDSPPEYDSVYFPKASPEELVARHRERLKGLEPGVQPLPITGQLEALMMDLERLAFDFNIRRGVYVEMTASEVEKIRAARPTIGTKSAPGWQLALWVVSFAVAFLSLRACGG